MGASRTIAVAELIKFIKIWLSQWTKLTKNNECIYISGCAGVAAVAFKLSILLNQLDVHEVCFYQDLRETVKHGRTRTIKPLISGKEVGPRSSHEIVDLQDVKLIATD